MFHDLLRADHYDYVIQQDVPFNESRWQRYLFYKKWSYGKEAQKRYAGVATVQKSGYTGFYTGNGRPSNLGETAEKWEFLHKDENPLE